MWLASTSGVFGTTVIALGFSAISLRIMSACVSGSASRAGHDGVNVILRRELFDPVLHALEPPDSGSLDDGDDPDFRRVASVRSP